MKQRDESEAPQPRFHLPASQALLSIFGFWLFYSLIVTIRISIINLPAQDELALRRIYVTLCGMVITVLVWLAMRLVDHRPFPLRGTIAAIASLPAAFAIAWANYYVFNIYDQASLMDIEAIRSDAALPGQFAVEITEVAVSRYFFLIAWAALYLALSFAHQVRHAERRTAALVQAAQKSELRALRYQLNPHFLFNALNSLSALVMTGKREEAETMIMSLATFYRANLSGNQSGDVPLVEEVRTQRLYLDLEALRFPDRLRVAVSLPVDLEEIAVPGLILQPLVENAIKHGVAKTAQPVTLEIRAVKNGDRVTVSVSDDSNHTKRSQGSGIGLTNVQDRLTARFGDDAFMTTGNKPNGGYETTLTFPEVRCE